MINKFFVTHRINRPVPNISKYVIIIHRELRMKLFSNALKLNIIYMTNLVSENRSKSFFQHELKNFKPTLHGDSLISEQKFTNL
ncbi:hypothetical protein BpHYR1_054338 [Brachionus plicatilis]|uniref:Uncharacterized protein n=1 Tax=Brachionus plicatilis TaxID=10195 RepID=A0A3M7S488_BRAPC|nr:hypothetical protein BpHYR1_054338 [Brachionus plicatilis]